MDNTAICYFSGTGNSFDISLKLNKTLNGSIFYIPNTEIEELDDYSRIIIVTPIYSFGLPIPTKDFIAALSHLKDKEYFVILHYGGFSANAAYFTKMQFEKQGLLVKNIFKMKMPESFTIVSTVPKFFIHYLLKKSTKKINRIAGAIKNNETKVIKKNIFSFCDNIYEKNAVNWQLLPKNFLMSDSCNGCGYCQEICPTKNITISNGRPLFKEYCVSCLACYQRCPQQAINYGKRTIGKRRYFNPNVDFSKMK